MDNRCRPRDYLLLPSRIVKKKAKKEKENNEKKRVKHIEKFPGQNQRQVNIKISIQIDIRSKLMTKKSIKKISQRNNTKRCNRKAMPFQILDAAFIIKDSIPPNEPFVEKNTICQKR